MLQVCSRLLTNYDAGIMYISLRFMPSLLHVLAVSNSTCSMSTVRRVREIWSHKITSAYVPKPTQFQHVLTNANLCCVLRYKFHVFKLYMYGSGGMVTQNYQCVQNHETWFTSRTHSSNYDGVVTMLDYVFINLNLCCIQWYKFHVCRGKGSRDTVTQIYSCDQNHEKWFISRAHSSISNGMSHYFYIPL